MNHINEKNPPNDEGVTPLHLAAENGHLNVCEYIMMRIEEKNPADIYGVTPLDLAEGSDISTFLKFRLLISNLTSNLMFEAIEAV